MNTAFLSLCMLLVTNSLFANCPNLSGSYICKNQEGMDEVTWSQSQNNGITSYVLTSKGVTENLIANGQKQVVQWGNEEPAEMTISCESNKLKMYIHGFELFAPGATGQFYMSQTHAGFNVEIEISIPGQETQNEIVSVCSKK